MSQRRTQKALSQPSTSSNNNFTQYDEDYDQSSQISPNKSLTSQEHAHHVANVIKYILAADHSKTPIVRSTICKSVECSGKNFRAIMNSVQEVLQDVFGYNLIGIENGRYILCNEIKNDLPHLQFDEEISNRYVLLFLILAHIYMNGEMCTEGSLINFLKRMNIIIDGRMHSETFGNILELISEFTKEKYIEIEKPESENQEPELKWGIRAHNELSVRSVMEFVSMVYDRDMDSWPQQYTSMLEKERKANAETKSTQNSQNSQNSVT